MALQIFLAMRIDAYTYVRYSAILSDNVEVDADIRISMAIPNLYPQSVLHLIHDVLGALCPHCCVCSLVSRGGVMVQISVLGETKVH